jgi:uncharacterized protein YjiK
MKKNIVYGVMIIQMFSMKIQASIADSLDYYINTISISKINGVNDSNISGVASNPASGTLYVVDNNSCCIYELSTSGTLIRRIPTSGFDDVEGIAHYSGNYFFISEEQRGNVDRITIPSSGTDTIYRSNGTIFNIGSGWGNSGIEGVCYRPSDSLVFAVKEKDPARLYTVYLDSTGVPDSSVENSPFNIESKSGDAADIFALPGGDFIIVDQEDNRLVGYGPSGTILSELSISSMKQPEGIYVDTSDGTIYVAGEPRELYVFKKDPTRIYNVSERQVSNTIKANIFKISGHTVCVDIYAAYGMNMSLDFFNLSGRIICSSCMNVCAGDNRKIVSIPGNTEGIYLCRIKTEAFTEDIKVLF